jgi:hypothetical protein
MDYSHYRGEHPDHLQGLRRSQLVRGVEEEEQKDSDLLYHFRTCVWRQIAQTTCGQNGMSDSDTHANVADIFIKHAVVFPPVSPL